MNRMVSQGASKIRVSQLSQAHFIEFSQAVFFVSQLVLRFFSPLKKALEEDFWVIFVDELSRTDGELKNGGVIMVMTVMILMIIIVIVLVTMLIRIIFLIISYYFYLFLISIVPRTIIFQFWNHGFFPGLPAFSRYWGKLQPNGSKVET